MSSKERFFQVVEHPERRDFYNFLQFFKFIYPLKMTSPRKNKGTVLPYDLLQIKNLIGFCVAFPQMVEPELDFWGCKNQKMEMV